MYNKMCQIFLCVRKDKFSSSIFRFKKQVVQNSFLRSLMRYIRFQSDPDLHPNATETLLTSVADPHLLLCGSGSGIQKMSIWIRIRILGGKD